VSSFLAKYLEYIAILFKQRIAEQKVLEMQMKLRTIGMDGQSAQKVSNMMLDMLIPGEKERRKQEAENLQDEMKEMMSKPIDVFLTGDAPTIVLPKEMLRSKSYDVSAGNIKA